MRTGTTSNDDRFCHPVYELMLVSPGDGERLGEDPKRLTYRRDQRGRVLAVRTSRQGPKSTDPRIRATCPLTGPFLLTPGPCEAKGNERSTVPPYRIHAYLPTEWPAIVPSTVYKMRILLSISVFYFRSFTFRTSSIFHCLARLPPCNPFSFTFSSFISPRSALRPRRRSVILMFSISF